jgi:hypothetical protein
MDRECALGDFEKSLNSGKAECLDWLRQAVAQGAERVALLGEWPANIDAEKTLVGRVPLPGRTAAGFDAGLACALDLIPRSNQRMAAALHANISVGLMRQAAREAARVNDDPGSATAWWLAACSICCETGVDAVEFIQQLTDFIGLCRLPKARSSAAVEEYQAMLNSFSLSKGYPYGERDGCMLGAYLAGYPVATEFAPNTGAYFIGTQLPDLGLAEFSWSCSPQDDPSCRSGPVAGSAQYVRCADAAEFEAALIEVDRHLRLRGAALDIPLAD